MGDFNMFFLEIKILSNQKNKDNDYQGNLIG